MPLPYWIKLPESFSSFFLTIHVVIFIACIFNYNYSIIFFMSVNGMVVGSYMHYYFENKMNYELYGINDEYKENWFLAIIFYLLIGFFIWVAL